MNQTEQILVGEIVAQHLEHRLQRKSERRQALGGEPILFQAITTGEITLYPEYTGSIVSALLKEQPSPDRDIVRERARGEMLRTAQLELEDPLGYDNPPVAVIRAADAEKLKIKTLSDAAAVTFRWKVATSYDFQQRRDVLPALAAYKLPLAEGMRGMEALQLFPTLRSGELSMILVHAAEGQLESADLRILADDRNAFAPYQACLLVRRDALMQEPLLRPALAQLAGKFTDDIVRKMAASVDLNHRKPEDVAADFLASAGLK